MTFYKNPGYINYMVDLRFHPNLLNMISGFQDLVFKTEWPGLSL
ncbi:hypothetical protein NARC_40172 [Candidatus Nitrosocosmicus arcticus]|uniref:Uncharacterized protein n=1 Tax=Candidatus Nitrosocosmicus arcticus TaxID=2035267 RepID=A0A557SX75_9ARCH|nr:hypothetical protein NARC_40172 [Candidatus Nitrosocosmicus arcticus]